MITSRRAHTCPSLSLICLSFFLQLNKPQKKNSSLSLSLRRVIYTYILREEKKTKAFALHYKTRLLLFLLLRVLFSIFDHLLRARERKRKRERHFKAEFGNCNFPETYLPRFFSFSERDVNDEKLKKK